MSNKFFCDECGTELIPSKQYEISEGERKGSFFCVECYVEYQEYLIYKKTKNK